MLAEIGTDRSPAPGARPRHGRDCEYGVLEELAVEKRMDNLDGMGKVLERFERQSNKVWTRLRSA